MEEDREEDTDMEKVYASVFSGGGGLCAYSAGACLAYAECHRDRVTLHAGVSAGALNAAVVSQFKNYLDGAMALSEIYRVISDRAVKRWTPFYHLNLLIRNYLYSANPLHRLVRKSFKPSMVKDAGNSLSVGFTDMAHGDYVEVDEKFPFIHDALVASCAAPPVYGPVKVGRHMWGADGGMLNMTPISSVIDKGATDIMVFLTGPLDMTEEVSIDSIKHGPGYLKRVMQVIMQGPWRKDLERAQEYARNHDSDIRINVCAPYRTLLFDPFSFDNEDLSCMFHAGYRNTGYVPLEEFLENERK